ncbi:MAG: metallophosphoesterase family protein [Geminicoccaceae bacterium]
MLKRLFQRGRTLGAGEPHIDGRPPALPRGLRVYAIGDIHGRIDLLLALEQMIAADIAQSGRLRNCVLVYLGDFVDRGFESRKVLDHLLARPADGIERVHLLGNHDLWLREFAQGGGVEEEMAASWIRFGGDATLLSYGIKLDLAKPEAERLAEAQELLQRRLPPTHATFLAELDRAFGLGDYFFCHAGIRPEVPLTHQSDTDLLWIREPFLSWNGSCGKIVVHGHTVEDQPVVRHNRIGIDTGACWTGRLTCLVLEGTRHRFLQTGSPVT